MYEVTWQEINSKNRLVEKRKSFKTEKARANYCAKLAEKDNFFCFLAYCEA